MTLTRELRTTVAFVLAIVLALTAFVWGNQRLVHADVLDIGRQVNCYLDKGFSGPFDIDYDYCGAETEPSESGDPSLAQQIICLVDWRLHEVDPEIPFDPDLDFCNMLENDICPNIPGFQETLPEGKVLEDGICVDADNGGGNGGGTGADLAVSKTVSDPSPAPSSTVVYTITVTSTGPASTTGVTVTDALPAGVSYVSDDSSGAYSASTSLWTIGDMASGTTKTLNITVMVMATTGVQVANTAAIAGSGASDPNSDNNSSTVTFTSTEDGQGGGGGNPQCSDGVDNDNDGDIDYPADDDCESASDDKEEQDSSSGGGGSSRRSSGGSRNTNQGEVLGAQTECSMYLTGYIRQGADNDMGEVAKLQVFLNMYEGNALTVNGIYDDATLAAVNAFQRKYATDVLEPWGLQGVTGYVYYTTQKQINTIYCKFEKDFPLSAPQIEEISYVREIQPTLRAQGVSSTGTTRGAAAGASTSTTVPAVGSVVLPSATEDENAAEDESADTASQTAAAANASSTPGWFGRFVNWLFGR